MGLMDLFGKKFDQRVAEAVTAMKAMNLGVTDLGARVDGKVVTLTGQAPSREVATLAMQKLDEMVEPDNIVNAIEVTKPPVPEPAEAVPAEEPTERIHEVAAGDTLGHIAQTYYGKASEYMKIFEANRDILDNPDLIKVGQRLRIPE